MENSNFTSMAGNNDSENAAFVTMTTGMLPVALYSTEIPFSTPNMMSEYYQHNNNTLHYANQQAHITTTPVVKSHNPSSVMYTPPYSQQTNYSMLDTTTTNIMNNFNSMEIDDYFTPNTMDNSTNMFPNTIYSPSTNSVNSSIMIMSPTSPTHLMSPPNHLMSPTQPMDTFVTPSTTPYHHLMMENHVYAEPPIVPTNIGMNYNHQGMMYNGTDDMMLHHHTASAAVQPYIDRKGRRPLPRRHTVSTPYATNNKGKEPMIETKSELNNSNLQQQQPVTKSRKSSLKAKRHRSLGKLDIYATASSTSPPPIPDHPNFEPPLTTKLEFWTHEQLLERVKELEKEKEESVTQNSNKSNEVTLDESGVPNTSTTTTTNTVKTVMSQKTCTNKVRSASHTDTEMEEDDEEEDDPQICKWDNCSIELNSLDDLINHVKIDHIGSGKPNYYCCWKDCVRKQKPFTKRHKMHNHLRTHTGERPFVCLEPDCGKRFSRPDSLTTHAKIHSNIRPYICSFVDSGKACAKAYYHLRSLRKHERSHQLKDDTHTPPPPPPPIPVVMSNVTHSDDLDVVRGEEVYSDWGLSAQAAVFNIMDRDNSSFI